MIRCQRKFQCYQKMDASFLGYNFPSADTLDKYLNRTCFVRPALCRELDAAMERRLEEMEKRLKEHVDRRLDALEQKLEKALLSALPLVLNQGTMSSSAGGAASSGLSEQTAPTPATH